MRKALAAFNEEQPVIPLEVRISIASGQAMVGDIGTTKRREFTVLGDVVNMAARIKGNASPGQIVLSGGTARLLPKELTDEPDWDGAGAGDGFQKSRCSDCSRTDACPN